MKRIGIISGMGAAAGCRLYDLLIKHCQAHGAAKDSDFPEVFLHSIPSAGMDTTGVSDPERVKIELLDSVHLMNQRAVDVILIACNSVHAYHDVFQAASEAVILDIVNLAVESAAGSNMVGVISSASTKAARLYEKELALRGVRTKLTTEDQQIMVDRAIARAIAGKNDGSDHRQLVRIMGSMMLEGAEKVILGCTELPLLGAFPRPPCIDPSELLIKKAMSL